MPLRGAAVLALAGLLPPCGADAEPCDRSAACPRRQAWSSGGLLVRGLRPACGCGESTEAAERQRLVQLGVGSWAAGLASGVLLDALLRRGGPEAAPPDAVVPEVAPGEQPRHRKWLSRAAVVSSQIDRMWRHMAAFAFAACAGVWVRRKWPSALGLLRRKSKPGKGPPAYGVAVFPMGKGKGPPPPGNVPPKAGPGGKGKGPPPGGKGKGPPAAKAKATSVSPRMKDGACASDQDPNACETPFGRRIHWVQPSYNEPVGDTIFGKLGNSDGRQFDQKLLTAIFTGDSSVKNRRKSFALPRALGKCLLDTQRAQSAAIMLNRLKLTTTELCRCVNELDFADSRLTVDDMEMIALAMPAPEESAKLLKCKEEVDQLRDIEQKLMPLCHLNPGRLRLMKFGMSHSASCISIISRCRVIKDAAEEAQHSTQFMEFLRLSLQVGNFINHGEAEMREGMVRAFALESLRMLSSCKSGAVSALHFVCLTLKSEDPGFMRSLMSGLSHLRQASREKTSVVEADVSIFRGEVQFVKSRFQQLGPDDTGKEQVEKLLAEVEQEEASLRTELSKALQAVTDAQAYFNVSVKKGSAPPTSEQFFGQIVSNLDNLQTAWREVEANGRRWERQFQTAQSSEAGAPPLDPLAEATPSGQALQLSPCSGERPQADGAGADEGEFARLIASMTPRTRSSCPNFATKLKGQRQSAKGGVTPGIQALRRAPPLMLGRFVQKHDKPTTPRATPRKNSGTARATPRKNTGTPRATPRESLVSPRKSPRKTSKCELQSIHDHGESDKDESESDKDESESDKAESESDKAGSGSDEDELETDTDEEEAGKHEAEAASRPISRNTTRTISIQSSGLCEFHAIHDRESDNEEVDTPSSMARSRTSFPDIWEFEPCPVDDAGSPRGERTWDFQISGTSAYATAFWRRQRQSGDSQPHRRMVTM